ncbi:NGLY1 [Symbiodinium sp. KB8]|nr:NGLY1 [Symbiodinium sp. KB8]
MQCRRSGAAFATLAFVFGAAIGVNFASVSEDGSMLRQFAGIRFGSRSALKTRMQDFARQELLIFDHNPQSVLSSDKLRNGAACALLVAGGLWLLRVTTGHLECWATSVGSWLSLKSVAVASPLLAAGCGAGAGALHTLSGPDHLAALAPLALRVRKGPGAAFRTGMFWGSGHVAGQLLLGSGLLLLSRSPLFRFMNSFQFGGLAEQLATLAVGFVLMTIGALGIKESREWDEDQNPESAHTSFSWKTFGTGMLSGMHPDALLLCLPALTLPTRSAGLIFLASFGAGSMLAMGGYTAALRAACRSLGEESVRKVSILASVMALTLGVGAEVVILQADLNRQKNEPWLGTGRLVRWFKHEFFSWTNAPRCEHCGSTETKTVGHTDPTPEEKHFKANTVEVAACSKCGGQTRFPRYNDPAKLLQTRTGRCGEWANCFTLVCRSLGYEARHVHDWTDHVWTEVFSDSKQRWLHVDSCEAALDSPLMYEKGWGKKLTYCIGFARDHVVDVTRRYTQSFEELKKAVSAIDEYALDRSLVPYAETVAAARRALLSARADAEAQETTHVATKAEEVGRTSGDAAWRAQRGELGANDAAKQKADTSRPSTGYKGAEDAQAALRARVAKLMATGLSANDALLKVLEEAKQKA